MALLSAESPMAVFGALIIRSRTLCFVVIARFSHFCDILMNVKRLRYLYVIAC